MHEASFENITGSSSAKPPYLPAVTALKERALIGGKATQAAMIGGSHELAGSTS